MAVKERDNGLTAVLLLVLAGAIAAPFAVNREASPDQTARPAPPAATAASPPGTTPSKTPRDVAGPLLAEFFPAGERLGPRTTAEVVDALREKGIAVSALVVTLPDPVDSVLDYAFDRSLDALQRALRVDGFLLDRYSLPWFDGAPRAGRSEPDESGQSGRAPGALLFRKVTPGAKGSGPRQELLAVFLVGETPISGLQKPALARALTEAHAINAHAAGDPSREREMRILGPFFSGSVHSLRLALVQWAAAQELAKPLKVRIVSGSTTVSWTKRVLEKGRTGFEGPVERLDVDFSATVVPDQAMREYLYRYLRELGVDFERVALLTESNTLYGQGWARRRERAPGTTPGPEPGVTIVFPMHISQLRAAYEKDKLLKPLSESKGPAGARSLELSLDDSARRRDAIPSVSGLSTASDELSLAAVLATLSRRRIQYVGIVATDVRDKLFLARQIALNCPGVTLFTLESDILLTHPKYAPFLRGMLVASTYPLYPHNQVWAPDAAPRELFQFPSGAAQGLFNAALVLLGKDDALVEYGPPFPQLVDQDPMNPRRRRPPVWLSVAGNTAAWPLDAFAGYEDPEVFVHLRAGSVPAEPLTRVLTPGDPRLTASRLSKAFLWALSFLTIAMAAYFAAANGRDRRPNVDTVPIWPDLLEYQRKKRPPDNPTLALLRLDDDKRAPYRKDLLLLLLVVPVFIVQVLAASAFLQPYRLAFRHGPDALASIPAGALLAAAGVLAALLATTVTMVWALVLSLRREGLLVKTEFRRFRRHPLRGGELFRLFRPGNSFLLVRVRSALEAVSGVTLIVLVLAVVSLTVYYAWPPELLAALLRFERLTNPISGLSILVPLLLLSFACAALAFCHLRRLTLDEWGGFEAALIGRRTSDLSGAEAAERHILRTIRQIWASPALSAGLTLLFGFLVVWLLSRLLPAPEGEPYPTLFRLVFFFACLETLFTALRYLLLWRRLRTFLRVLSIHPMADAFDRVPRRLAGAVGPRAFGRFISLPDFAQILHLWRLLKSGFEAARPGLEKSLGVKDREAAVVLAALAKIDTLRFDFSGRLRRYGGRLLQTWKARVQTAESVARMARILQPVVEPYWLTKPLPQDPAPAGKEGAAPAAESSSDRRAIDPAALSWLRKSEELLASHLVIWVAYVFLHLRNLLSTYVLSVLLLFLSITAYPFQPARFLVFFLFGFVVLLAAITVGTFIQMDRDEILSRVARTPAGKVSWDFAFIVRLFLYGIVPILSVVGASIPEVQTGLSSVIDSLSRVIK